MTKATKKTPKYVLQNKKLHFKNFLLWLHSLLNGEGVIERVKITHCIVYDIPHYAPFIIQGENFVKIAGFHIPNATQETVIVEDNTFNFIKYKNKNKIPSLNPCYGAINIP